MMKKMISFGALCALVSTVSAATTVWTEDGPGEKAPAYWLDYVYPDKTTLASVDTSTTAENVKVAVMHASAGSTDNGAGFGFAWAQNSSYQTIPVNLSAYKGVCLTYSATTRLRMDFKQSNLESSSNFYGTELDSTNGFKKVFIAFNELKQGWTSSPRISWDVTSQKGVQFGYKKGFVTNSANTSIFQLKSFILGNECETFAPVLVEGVESPGSLTLNEGNVHSLDLTEIFVDPDGEALTYTVSILAENAGDVVLADDQYNTTHVLNLKTGYNPKGGARVTVTAKDPTNKTAVYELDVTTVDGENAPVAVNDSYTTQEEKALSVDFRNFVTVNDDDADGDKYVPELVTSVSHGTLDFDVENGGFTYTPAKDFFGEDAFTYQLKELPRDGDDSYEVKTSNVATVTISVTNVDDPIQVEVVNPTFKIGSDEYELMKDTVEVDEDFSSLTVKISTTDVVFSDPDVTAASLQVKAMSSGVVSVDAGEYNGNYLIRVDAVEDSNGVAKVTLFAADNGDTASVWFFVKVNSVVDPPVAVNDAYTVVQDSVNKIAASKGVLANDVNPDGKTTLKAYLVADASKGKVTLAEDGSFTYAAGKEKGSDSFTYYIVNAEGVESEPATVTLTVAHKNLPPQIVAGVADTVGNRLSSLTEDFSGIKRFTAAEVKSWFADDEDATLTFTTRTDDSLLAPTMVSGALQIKAVKDACGDAQVIVIAADTKGAKTELAIPAKIACVNDKPVLVKYYDSLYVGTESVFTKAFDLKKWISDPDGDVLSYKVLGVSGAENFISWTIDGDNLILSSLEGASLEPNKFLSIKVVASDASTSTTMSFAVLTRDAPPAGIAPQVAAAKLNWRRAIATNHGAVALFDMQGRVMWKAKLPVSEADVRNAAAQVQGRKILQVNRQSWTIK
ncbi:MAG: cadherin-like domain-containing protein [Fibrobacter sp.]|nr:cadherin-like domain-containing protein [Fibrobacter sp.]